MSSADPDLRDDAADPLGVGAIGNILGFHIRLAYGAVYRHFMETFAHLELTQKQVSVLWLIDDQPGIAQTDLARRLRMDRATTMGVVNRLQGRDFLTRGKSTEDRRRQTLYLTREGEAALKEAKAAIFAHEKWLKARFSAQEVETLKSLLMRIYEDPAVR
jgi:DNA-binding MarR family transcriptional regulator